MNLDMDLDALVAKLESCRTAVAIVGTRKALRAGGTVIKRAMQQFAPVQLEKQFGSDSLEPGELKASIRVYLPSEKSGEEFALVGPARKTERVARWVEFGHRMVTGGYSKVLPNGTTRGPGKVSIKDVREHPFLRPAYESSIEAAIEAEKLSLAQTIQEQVK